MKRRTLVLIAVAVIPMLGGCGGASHDQGAPPPSQQSRPTAAPTTRADLIAEARKICARIEGRMPPLRTPTTPPTAKQMLGIIDAWAVTVDELRRLKPPPAEASRFGRMLTHFEAAIRAARSLPTAKDETALVPIAAMADEGMKGGTIAHAYGLDECSLFPPAPSKAEFERYVLERARKEGGFLGPRARANPPGGRLEDRAPKAKRP